MGTIAEIALASNITGLHEDSVQLLMEGGEAIAKTLDGLLLSKKGRIFLACLFCAFHTACNGIKINDDPELDAALKDDMDRIRKKPLADQVINLIADPYEETQSYYMMYMQRALHNLLAEFRAEYEQEKEDNEELRPET